MLEPRSKAAHEFMRSKLPSLRRSYERPSQGSPDRAAARLTGNIKRPIQAVSVDLFEPLIHLRTDDTTSAK